MSYVVVWLRDAPWVTRERMTAYGIIFVTLHAAAILGWLALSRDGLDIRGKAIGTDFTSFWAASRLALDGRAVEVYRPEAHYATQMETFGGAEIGYSAFFYPPIYLLVCLPLALLPYLAALAAWLAATGYAYWRVACAYLGTRGWPALGVLAFPAGLINAGHGQNAFLTTSLFGGGLLLLRSRPVLAGVLFGCLAFKPHLALVLPIALAALGRWDTILAAGATALALAALSFAVFGAETWAGFLAVSSLAREALEANLIGYHKMQSVFAALRQLGSGLTLAYAAQAAIAAVVCAVLVALLRRRPEGAEAAVAASALLMSPFLLDYDLALLVVPLAWTVREGMRTGFLPWEKTLLAGAFMLPLVSRLVAAGAGIPLAPAVLLALFWVVVRRAWREVRSARPAAA